jgi:glycosyltransferase involved in cell wall biosynthesis
MVPGTVLHVSPYSGEAWGYGGIPRVVAAQTEALAARSLPVTLATSDACGARQRLARSAPGATLRPWHEIKNGLVLRVFPNLSNTLAYRAQMFLPVGLDGFLRRSAGTFWVGHLHGCHNVPGALAARRLWRAGVPYVLQPNGTAPRIERRQLAKLLFDSTLGRSTLRHAARVIAVSEAERRTLLAMGVAAERIVVIPNPVEAVSVTWPAPGSFRRRHGIGQQPLVVYLGQLSPRKEVATLLSAIAALDDTAVQLVVAGPDQGCLAALRRQARALGIESRARFPGVLAGEDRLAVLADADVAVYATRHEVFGLVPLEALLCGTPVVVGDDSGCGEVVSATDGGLLVPPGDVAALRDAIAALLAAPEGWRGRARQAGGRVRELFAPTVVAERLMALYAEVAGETR